MRSLSSGVWSGQTIKVDLSQAPWAWYAFLVCQPSVPNEIANIAVAASRLNPDISRQLSRARA